jgi:integrase
MKSKRTRRIPLSEDAVATLIAVQGHSRHHEFPGNNSGGHLSNAAMMQVLKRMALTDITVHGFRSAFRDWYAESTNYPAEVAEMALAHTLRDKTEAAYRRGDLFEKRARLMADWARCCSKLSTPATVVAIRQRGR